MKRHYHRTGTIFPAQDLEEKSVGARERQDPPARLSERDGRVREEDGEGGCMRVDRARQVSLTSMR